MATALRWSARRCTSWTTNSASRWSRRGLTRQRDDSAAAARFATSSATTSARQPGAGRCRQIISYEEYYPYGSTSYQAGRSLAEVSVKRYRYTGKERDEETGLYYHGARYYAPWLGRWTSADPIGISGGINLYQYAAASPVGIIDSTGREPKTTYLGSSKDEHYVARLEKAWGGNQYWADEGPNGAGWYAQTEGNRVVPIRTGVTTVEHVRVGVTTLEHIRPALPPTLVHIPICLLLINRIYI